MTKKWPEVKVPSAKSNLNSTQIKINASPGWRIKFLHRHAENKPDRTTLRVYTWNGLNCIQIFPRDKPHIL